MPLTKLRSAFPSKGDRRLRVGSRPLAADLAPFHEKGASHGSVQCCDEARFLGLFAARKLAQQLRGRGEFFDLPDSDVVSLKVHFGGARVKYLTNRKTWLQQKPPRQADRDPVI